MSGLLIVLANQLLKLTLFRDHSNLSSGGMSPCSSFASYYTSPAVSPLVTASGDFQEPLLQSPLGSGHCSPRRGIAAMRHPPASLLKELDEQAAAVMQGVGYLSGAPEEASAMGARVFTRCLAHHSKAILY
ncbi:unnamed protein product [Protopolystoma xenopodis]|uniref:Uncharacterized protein n=1 Tax=Protopolystoma xenopodis TaxID=117903 RepID=A0A3S5AXB6_9PLAT|nr:unnamed protein product [Protopolystoma xenopodis]